MTHSIISKRRRRRLRGKPDDFGRRLLAQKGSIPEDVDLGYGEDALAVLAPLIERAKLRRPFTTAELSPEQVALIEQMQMDPRHDHLNKILDD